MSLIDVRGRFLWYDLMTTDPQAAQEFYTKVAGWGLQPYAELGTPYTVFLREGTPVGGVMSLADEAVQAGSEPHWLVYIGTPNVDATTEQAVKLGARTHVAPQDIPTVGRYSVVADPQGAVVAFYSPANPQPASHAPRHGDVSWHQLGTTDLDGALRFYQRLAGWEQTGTHDLGPNGAYQMFGRGGYTFGGIFQRPSDGHVAPRWLIYIRVADVLKAVELVKRHGGQVLEGPREVPGGDWTIECRDPQGAMFALHERKTG